ncbi:flagellar hook-basal body complex protein FliE [Oscillospiraceae bacterium OttesenSCG-928-G22]|nr:flagellar hook-basal body complex protein FliE [Oscillospiraceae bacterium OttesenSCG-928-G22]
MELNKIVSNVPNSILNPKAEEPQNGVGFVDFFKDAMRDTVEADATDKLTNVDTIAGTLSDIHTATIAADKADLALRLTIEIRNKAIDAYSEIMRMSM